MYSFRSSECMKKNRPIFISAGFVILLIIAAVWFQTSQQTEDALPADWIFIVNGLVITESDVEAQYQTLTPKQKETTTRNVVVQALFERILLLDATQRAGIFLTEEDYNIGFTKYLEENDLTEAQLQSNLGQNSLDMQDFESSFRIEVIIDKYLDRVVPLQVGIIDSIEIESRYEKGSYAAQGITFEDIEKQLVDEFLEERRQQAIRKHIADLRNAAQIVVREDA